MDRGAWQATVHGVAKSQTQLSDFTVDGKEYACNAGDLCLIPESGRPPEEGNGYPLQYSCLQNCTDRGAWWARVHGAAICQT